MTINDRSYSQICGVLDSLVRYEELTINELANRSNTSTATIIRFCKKEGYDTFAEFKENLIKTGLKQENALSSLLSAAQNTLDEENNRKLMNIELKKYDQIYVYCKQEYNVIIKQFNILLNKKGINVSVVFDESYIFERGSNTLLLSVGPLPNEYYYSDVNYVVISYDNFNQRDLPTNIEQIKINSPIYNNYSPHNLNYRIFCIYSILTLLVEYA